MAALQCRWRVLRAADAGAAVPVRPGVSPWLDLAARATSTCSRSSAIRSPRLALFVLCMLSLFHWAHRFRYTLYDGLQIKHLNEVIAVLCYGGAIVGTVAAAYLLWQVPLPPVH